MITKENFRDLLLLLGFKENPTQIFTKPFENTTLKADFKAQKLLYPANTSPNLNEPNGIIIHDDTTSNFAHPENFVVFECVHRLLEKGYSPAHIELEPRWNLGKEAKGGKADILVRDNERNPYLLIECKTTDSKNSEFVKEWRRMQSDGGQLFSYFQQERGVKFLCLYTSDLATLEPSEPSQESQQFSPIYQNYIIATQDNKEYLDDLSAQHKQIFTGYAHATNNIELFEVWREVYKLEYAEIGIFERNINAYEAGKNALCFDDLQELSSYNDEGKTYEDGKYHEFAKILRKYNISGKENAFDKLVNLFLCKIYDENHNKEILHFCYRGNASDSIESMQDRLMLLYKEAMKEFLGEEITYVSDEQIETQFSDFKRHKIKTKRLQEQMQEFIRQLKFYSHSDFSFLEVHNKELFLQNGEVLKAVVKLFEKLKLTQNKTNQLLGNLFELFLQKGMKQDEGQFFTPMPICEFIIHSLPLDSMLRFSDAPKVIDYACGAGHFLNTYANIISQMLPQDLSPTQRRERLDALFSQIHGIEKEYRLSKVAKVAAAMFSQEKINITYADALDFARFPHNDFDLLISNPPYSVKGFAETLSKDSYAKYELAQKVSDKDSFNAIECFFIERANALLRGNAKLAIVLPSSILNKGGVYESTREILLRNFNLIAIVELGSATFGATGTNTIILFATKRETYANSHDSQSFLNLCENITDSLSFENVYLGQFLREYCAFMDYSQDDFSAFLRGEINENLAKTPAFSEYKKAFLDSSAYQNLLKNKIYKDSNDKERLKESKFAEFALEIEKDKLLYFALNYQNEVLIIKSPSDTKEQKKFLGYEWSNRKGDEGLKELNSPYTTPLFDRANPHNPLKLNTLIKNAFLCASLQSESKQSTHDSSLRGESQDSPKQSKSSESNKNVELMTQRQINTDTLQVSNSPKAQNLSNGLPRFAFGKSRNDESITEIPPELQAYAFKARLVDMLDFSRAEFSKAISLNPANSSLRASGANAAIHNPFLNSRFEMVRLGEVLQSNGKGKRPASFANKNGIYPFIKSSKIVEKCNEADFDMEALIIGDGGGANIHYFNGKFSCSDHTYIFTNNNKNIVLKFFYEAISANLEILEAGFKGIALKNISKTFIENIQIPLPPLEIQRQIINECESVESQSQNIKDLIALYKDLIQAILAKCGISEIAHPLRHPSAMDGGQADLTSTMERESHLSLRESALADSWQSMNPDKIINALLDLINTLQSNLDFKILPTPKSPPQGRGLDLSLAINTPPARGLDSPFAKDAPPQTPRLRGGAYFDSPSLADSPLSLSSSLARGKSQTSPSLADSPLSLSPSLAEGALAWVQSPDSSLRGSEATEAIHESKIDCHDLTASNLAMTELLKSLPTPPKQGWDKVALGEVCSVASGGTPKREVAQFWNGNINWLKSEVCQNCYVYENQVSEQITELGLQKSSAKMLKKNSVLIALVGATIGKIGYLTFESTTNQNIAGLYPLNEKNLMTKFLYFATMGLYPKFKERAGFNMANLTFIKNLKIPLPPLCEQEKIISCIEAIESKIASLDSTLPALESTKSQILQQYLFANA